MKHYIVTLKKHLFLDAENKEVVMEKVLQKLNSNEVLNGVHVSEVKEVNNF